MYGTVWYFGCRSLGGSLWGCSEDAAAFRRDIPLLYKFSVLVSVLVPPPSKMINYHVVWVLQCNH